MGLHGIRLAPAGARGVHPDRGNRAHVPRRDLHHLGQQLRHRAHFAALDNGLRSCITRTRASIWHFARLADQVGRECIIFGADLPYYDYR